MFTISTQRAETTPTMASSPPPRNQPPRLAHDLVERADVLHAWQANRHKSCHVLLGPAGSGKTTLALQWRSRLFSQGFDVAWMSAQPDDEPEALMDALFAAFDAITPEICQELHLLYNRDGQFLLSSTLAISLIRSIERHGRDTLMVIDDYQNIRAHQAHAMVQTLLDYAPPNLHLLLISRQVPPLQLERLRAASQLHELDVQDLRFSLQDTQEFARQRLPALAPEAVHRLHQLTDGWAAGLQLFVLGMQAQPKRTHWHEPVKNAHDFVAYFNREVLHHLAPERLHGLLRLSPVHHFNEALVVAMLGPSAGQDLMGLLEAQRMFIMPMDEPRAGWWRFHPLFRELLLERFEQAPKELQRTTRIRLGNWFGEKGMLRDAVQLLVAAGEIDQATDWIERHARELFLNGELQRLVRAVAEIPRSYLKKRDSLTLWLGWSQLCYRQFDACQESIDRLEHHLQHQLQHPQRGRSALPQTSPEQAHACMLQFSLALQTDDFSRAQQLLPHMLHMRSQSDAVLQGGRRNLLGWYFSHQGTPAQAREYLLGPGQYREDGSPLQDSSFGNMMSLALLGMTHLHEGHYRQAEATLRAALSKAEAALGSHCEAACNAAGLLCEVLYEINDLQGLRELLERYGDAIDKVALPDARLSATLARSRLLALDHNLAEAQEVLVRLENAVSSRKMLRITAILLYEQFQLSLREHALSEQNHGCLVTLVALAQRAADKQHHAAEKISHYATLAQAQWQAHQHQRHDPAALRQLQALAASPQLARRLQISAIALPALALQRAGQDSAAEDLALQILEQAQASDMVRSVLDLDEASLQLLRQVHASRSKNHPILGFYAARLLKLADEEQASLTHSAAAPRLPADALSERELQILSLLANALPNKRIAQALGVSPETIKWHLKNIYTKLSVFSRNEAIVVARELGVGLPSAEHKLALR
ncbi:hypothetical protein E8K88_14785 [Lampropedia aestuarii]|uniref:HTH luxR-type domain-containing protein n=1 Tax=Lampropedia aestuarii TaxID=2562762 RepID=A0A4S5BPN9_9BURK|nr:LuxR C-terminal-related transcriptional regulator [Lampropedia aestuarii]THJ31576.1 hypothetical protein E8K88_14785 [Lampropedia aestuarii]